MLTPQINFVEKTIAVQSWDTSKRLAVSWTINGLKPNPSTADGSPTSVRAISALFLEKNQSIANAWSFYDDTPFTTGEAGPEPFNASSLIENYITLGAGYSYPSSAFANCQAWANQFDPNGQSDEPGVHTRTGTTDLIALCKCRANSFKIITPAVHLQIPVMSWDTTKRVAFRYTLAGVDTNGNTAVIDAISVLFLNPDLSIVHSWDFWDDKQWPAAYEPCVTN